MEESEKTEESCRLCDETSEKMLSIFDKNEEGIEILQVIKDCVPIIIYRTDPLSKQICESCYETLNSLSSFKKNCEDIAQKQKEKLTEESDGKEIQAFLACGEVSDKTVPFQDEMSDLKDSSTSTDDLNILCNNCKQTILDSNTVNGELELAIAESMVKNKVKISNSEKSLRRRKVVPFYHELDDSLCSSLTEFTHNTEGSQCFEDNSEIDGSDDSVDEFRPRKRRRIIESDDETENDSVERNLRSLRNNVNVNVNGKDDGDDVEDDRDAVDPLDVTEEEEVVIDESALIDKYMEEDEYRYQPFSLLQLCLNVINKTNVPEYEPDDFFQEVIFPECNYCGKQFRNLKVLAIHEHRHIDVEVGEKIDNPIPWHSSRDDAEVRNKWLNYFDENGYEDDDIVVDELIDTDNLLIPVEDKINRDSLSMKLTGDEKIVLVGTQPMVNDVYLGDYSKDDRKLLYQSMRIAGVNKKFCPLCRYTFKDNWAIESHYFSLACYYTCRYCGMRFNKQRHKFQEHCDEHESKKDEISEKIFAASKLSNIIPKIIHPPKPRRIVVTQHNPPPEMIAANNQFFSGQNQNYVNPYVQGPPQPKRSFMERKTLQPNLQIKEEPKDPNELQTSQSKTGNQAYFCRKCYKVFFKLDEFNVHSKNCDFSQFPQMRNTATNAPNAPNTNKNVPAKNGDVSPAGRPVRNCAKEIGPYKDDVYLPDHILKDPKPSSAQQTFVCFICNTPFPTIYSRNSHMRIHKGETQPQQPPYSNRPRFPNPPNHQQMGQLNYRQPPLQQQHYPPPPLDAMIKQEPMDPATMEPMVEIHEQGGAMDQNFPDTLGDGAVSITPISKNPKQKPMINPNVMKLVQNNPQLSIKKSPEKMQMAAGTSQVPMGLSLPDPDRSYKCSSCWEAFANKSHLYFHKKNQCEGSRLPCPFCKKRFGTEAEYSSHIYYSHPE